MDCSICLESLDNNLCSIKCGHVFHRKCLKEVLSNKCPLCREVFQHTTNLIFEFVKKPVVNKFAVGSVIKLIETVFWLPRLTQAQKEHGKDILIKHLNEINSNSNFWYLLYEAWYNERARNFEVSWVHPNKEEQEFAYDLFKKHKHSRLVVSKLTGLFNGQNDSSLLNNQMMDDSTDIEFTCMIKGQHLIDYCNTLEVYDLKIPLALEDLINKYNSIHRLIHPKRTLQFDFSSGRMTLKLLKKERCFTDRCTIEVPTIQGLILLLFNDTKYLTLKEIATSLNYFNYEYLEHSLQSISSLKLLNAPSVRHSESALSEWRCTKSVSGELENVYSVNMNYKPIDYNTVFPSVSLVHVNYYKIDATIYNTIKNQFGWVSKNWLLVHLKSLSPSTLTLEKRIENLISREYLQTKTIELSLLKSQGNLNKYTYIERDNTLFITTALECIEKSESLITIYKCEW